MEREQFLSKEKTKFLGIATTAGILYAIGDFPALIVDPAVVNSALDGASRHLPTAILEPGQFAGAERQVRGELFEIFDPITFFGTLDVIEGYWPDQAERSLFVRQLITVLTERGETQAWAYVLNLPINGLSHFDPEA